jgi:hypothetical protein
MRIRVSVPEQFVQPSVINAALEAVTRVNQAMIKAGDVPTFDPDTPRDFGIRWRPENMGDEHFDHAGIVMERKWGDCDDLAPWRAASLRETGEDAGAVAIAVPSGPDMYHALVRRSDGSNDDPSVAAGMASKSVVGDGENLISVWACDPHDGRLYQGSLAPSTAPLGPHVGPMFAARALYAPGSRSVVGYQARVDCPTVGSKVVRVHSYTRGAPHRTRLHRGRVHGFAPYSLSHTAGGEDVDVGVALSHASASALHAGVHSGTISAQDKYKLLAMHRLLSGAHPSSVTIELAQEMAKDHVVSAATQQRARGVVHGTVVGDFGDFLQSALGVVNDIAPALAAIPVVGPAISAALPIVNSVVHPGSKHPSGPAQGMRPQPRALAATQHVHAPVSSSHKPAPPRPGTHPSVTHTPHAKPAPPHAQAAAAAAAAASPATAAQQGQTATAMNWAALQAMHDGNYQGSFGPFVVTF